MSEQLESIINIQIWNKGYPDRLQPGIVPNSSIYRDIAKIMDTSYNSDRGLKENNLKIDLNTDFKINPELAPKSFYHDGTPINWNDLEESNRIYLQNFNNYKANKDKEMTNSSNIDLIMKRIDDKLEPYVIYHNN